MYLVRLAVTDWFGVYSDSASGPNGRRIVFSGTLDECVAFRRV